MIPSRARCSLVRDPLGMLSVLASYTLNREAADVALEFYGPDLEPLGSLTGQTVDAGTNWSDVETLTGCTMKPKERSLPSLHRPIVLRDL